MFRKLYRFISTWKISVKKVINLFRQKRAKIFYSLLGSKLNTNPQLFDQLFAQACKDKTSYVPLATHEPLETDIKLIAFYLPQFHPIAENDEWWGKGFTEWTNVAKAVPQFVGHYQPRLPDELGFYDLRLIDVQKRQIELAKNYGIHGFCYHHYWFAGKKLLSRPFQQVLENPELDLPFCLCWANENWTRRWDGSEDKILIKQNYSPEDDIAFIKDIEVALRDKRYIRIKGRPLLMVYRISLLPDPKATAKRWREYCISVGIGDLYLVATQSFDFNDPLGVGFDALVEFPPHFLSNDLPVVNHSVELINPIYQGKVLDYHHIVQKAKQVKKPKFPLFRTVFPAWDNEARRPGRGNTFIHSTPALYRQWLKQSIAYTQEQHENKFVFINAWNEWAEGAHLEPDQKHGYAYLQATRDALAQSDHTHLPRNLIIVSHDAHLHGAQHLALALAKKLHAFGFKLAIVFLGGGDLMKEFSAFGKIYDLADVDAQSPQAIALAEQLLAQNFNTALVNTTVSGLFLATLARTGISCVSLVHELPGVIKSRQLELHAKSIAEYADKIIFPDHSVATAFEQFACVPVDKTIIRPQGLIRKNAFKEKRNDAHIILRHKLNLPCHAKIVLNVGFADLRKGVDLFVEIGLLALKNNPDLYFVWLGNWGEKVQALVKNRLAREPLAKHFIFHGYEKDPDIFFAGADVFALTSREDPFPSVILHALEVGLPVIGFAQAGGFTELLEHNGILVQKENILLFADAVLQLLASPEKMHRLGQKSNQRIANDFSLTHYIFDLLHACHCPLKRVSVIVPNYNYAQYLEKRLLSILNQTYPIYEIIILDDASTDNSLEVIQAVMANTAIEYKIICNAINSKSVFSQWKKGAGLARGDFLWICEADDFAETDFLQNTLSAFDDEKVVLSYSQSKQVNAKGGVLSENYLDYIQDINPQKWQDNYICDGKKELAEALAIKNTIPNVSAVLFRKNEFLFALRQSQLELKNLKVAGDWLIYAELMNHGKIAFTCDSLNSHRRHNRGVTSTSCDSSHLNEIIFMQNRIANMIDLDSTTSEKAKSYLIKAKKHLGLLS